MTILLHDEEVHKHLSYAEAVNLMEAVFVARAKGETAGSPRWELPFGDSRMTFTVGAVPEAAGFRTYLRGNYALDEQLVAVWNRTTGALKGLIVGVALGVLRTGAIGGVAVKYLAPESASTLGIIGTGRQAFMQVMMISSVRPIEQVWVYSRNDENRKAFCDNVKKVFPDLKIEAVDSAEKAVREAQIISCATTSKNPVILGEWLMPNAHVSTLGTKGKAVREVDEAVVNNAAWVVSDSPEQSRNYPDGTILDDSNTPLYDLAEVVTGKIKRPKAGGFSLFLSSGLAGTEVALGNYLIDKVLKS